jgi:hypothetical protein
LIMQNWEYVLVRADDGKVTQINNEQVGDAGFTGLEGESLHTYLNRVGHEGWEAVSMSAPTSAQCSVLLKRPAQLTEMREDD